MQPCSEQALMCRGAYAQQPAPCGRVHVQHVCPWLASSRNQPPPTLVASWLQYSTFCTGASDPTVGPPYHPPAHLQPVAGGGRVALHRSAAAPAPANCRLPGPLAGVILGAGMRQVTQFLRSTRTEGMRMTAAVCCANAGCS